MSSVSIHKSPSVSPVVGAFAWLKFTGIAVTVFVRFVKACAVASTPDVSSSTVFSSAVILLEFDVTTPSSAVTSLSRVDIALALADILVSSTVTKAVPLYLYCFLLAFVSNHKSPVCNAEPSGLAVGSSSCAKTCKPLVSPTATQLELVVAVAR